MTASDFRSVIAQLGMSQTGCAKFLRVNDRTVRRWAENGDVPYAAEALLRLMAALNIRPRSLPKLLGQQDEPTNP